MIKLASRIDWKHGLKTAIAAGISLALVRLLRLPQGYWACITTIVVMQSEIGATITASRDRLVGTAIGVFVGWIAAAFWQDHLVAYVIVVLVCMVIPQMMGLKNAGRMAGVGASIVLLVPSGEAHWRVARDRFFEVSVGILVALAVSQAIWRKTTLEETPPAHS